MTARQRLSQERRIELAGLDRKDANLGVTRSSSLWLAAPQLFCASREHRLGAGEMLANLAVLSRQ
jgi:hypothetical protein